VTQDQFALFNAWVDDTLGALEVVIASMRHEAFSYLPETSQEAWFALAKLVPLGIQELIGVHAALAEEQKAIAEREAGALLAAEARKLGLDIKP
jgi:hypothetical protein